MKLSTLSIISLVAAGAFALTGCTSASEDIGPKPGNGDASTGSVAVDAMPLDADAAALVPTDLAERGYITAAFSPTFAPFEFFDSDNKTIVGFDVDFMQAIGEVLGLEVKNEASSFEAILPGLSSGKFDVSNSSLAITEERKQNADFVVFAQAGSGIGVAPGNPKDISNSFEALCGLKIAAGKGTTQGLQVLPELSDECVAAGKDAIDMQLFPSQNDGFMALQSNRIDGYMADSFTVGYQGLLSDGAFELAPGDDFMPVTAGIAMSKDSELTAAVRAAVLKIVDSDVYSQMNAKWGLPETTKVSAEQVNQ